MLLTLYAIVMTVCAVTCLFGWLGCRSRLREEREWTEHYRQCLERRARPRTTADRIEAWLREARP